VAVLLIISLFLPNTQQLLAAYEPILEHSVRPALFSLKLNLGFGLALGCLLFWVIRSYYATLPSPFLYFNF